MIKLIGHEFSYDVFQILMLFFEKESIRFINEGELANLESILELEKGYAITRIVYDNKDYEEKIEFPSGNVKKAKNAIKLSIVKLFTKIKDVDLPWGILIGIRPTKIIHDFIKQGLSYEEVYNILLKEYNASEGKANLAIKVAKKESPFLENVKRSVSLYINIPFCPSRCIYCSFASTTAKGNEKLIENYLKALIDEIKASGKAIKNREIIIDAVYIGGGTPSVLTENQLRELLAAIKTNIDLTHLREFTIECGRPDSIDEDKLIAIKESGCTRISINPQTMNDETLIKIGRNHNSKEIIEKFNLAREMGFDNINMDIIIGLPGENESYVEKTLEELKKLKPESITIHTLALKRASKLNEMGVFKRDTSAYNMYDIAVKGVKEMGMEPYYMYRQKNMISPLENIGYSFDGCECIYNVQMIAESISIVALGAGAITKLVYPLESRIERVANVKDVREYIKRKDEMIENKVKAIYDIYVD